MADTTLIEIGEGIMREELVTSTKEAAEVASEDELTNTSEGALTCRTVLSSKGSPHKTVICSSNQKMKKQKTNACSTVLSSFSKSKAERLCCIFPGSTLEMKVEIKKIFKEETELLLKSDKMKKTFKDIKICAIHKTKKSFKNLVVKTKM